MTFRLPALLEPTESPLGRPRRHRRFAGLYLGFALVLVPWTIFLFVSLPDRNVSHLWSVTWGGFDVLLVVVFVGCAYRILRLSPLTASISAAAAALLVTDAWFDITLAGSRRDFWIAVAMAALVELPVAAMCVRTSWRVIRVLDQARPYLRAAGFRVVHGELVPPPDWPFPLESGDRAREPDAGLTPS